jgi:alanine-glyoxylate transaminase/serine-glyoxylate transaminase/serine-pyruvate transaminase
MAVSRGLHFFQNPGPTNIPDRVLRAMDRGTIDFTGAQFKAIAEQCFAGLKRVFKTEQTILGYAASGHGAWEAALVNLFSPGDKVLVVETGYFSLNWGMRCEAFGLEVETLANDWRRAADPAALENRLREDRGHQLKAVLVVHNETSTGVVHDIAALRRAIDAARHPALFLVDVISSLASIDFRMDEWGVDVVVAGSQKGLMLPPGLGFNAVSKKALAASETAKLPRSYWDWQAMRETAQTGFFPYTPATNLLFGLREALHMLLEEEGLPAVFRRHARHAEATRRAVAGWGLEVLCADPREHSSSLTAIVVPDGFDADRLRRIILDNFDMSLGTGLGRLKGKIFRIGHLGWFNDLMLCGTLSGVEMGLHRAGIPHRPGGVSAALEYLAS